MYMHTNSINKKVYIGITQQKLRIRWKNGLGYRDNEEFYSDIKKYGWDNFTHEIIKDKCDYKEARDLETDLIIKYDSVNNGYNTACNRLNKNINIDIYNFKPISNSLVDLDIKENNYFCRIPNYLIQNNLKKTYNIHRVVLITYFLIDRHRSIENDSYLVMQDIMNILGYNTQKRKPKIFYEIIKSLLFLQESNMIEISDDIDIYDITCKQIIPLKIIAQNFDATDNFTKLSGKDFDFIMMNESSINKENILMAFLYINSYIFIRPKNKDSEEVMYNPESKPEAFWRSIESMSKELSMSKDTINQCIQYLTSSIGDKEPLLIKKEVGSVQPDPKKPPQNVPNIYVLNKEGYEQEIEWAIAKMLEIYNVNSFGEIKNGNNH